MTQLIRRSNMRVAAYILLAAAGVFGFWRQQELFDRIQAETLHRVEVDRLEAQRTAFGICEASNDVRAVILQLIIDTRDGGGTDFTRVPGYEDLDPAMQTFLQNLSGPDDEPEGEDPFLQRARELLVQRNCENL